LPNKFIGIIEKAATVAVLPRNFRLERFLFDLLSFSMLSSFELL